MTIKKTAKHVVTLVLALCLILGILLPAGVSANAFTVYNANVVARDDAGTSMHFNWKTARTSSSSIPQPETALLYCRADQVLDVATAERVDAERTTTDRTSYFKVSLTRLQPGTEYKYAILETVTNTLSAEYRFKTASPGTTTILAMADANYRSTSSYANYWGNTVNTSLANVPEADLLIQTGTFVSSTSSASHWDGFFNLDTQKVLAGMPIVPTSMVASSANKQFIYNFNLPATGNNTDDYSVVHGDALVLVVNTYMSSTAQITAHANWLRQEVAAKGADKWIIVAMPKSFYGKSSNTSTIKRQLEPVFNEIGASLVIQGDDRVYARSHLIKNANILEEYPSDNSYAAKDGIIYMTPGSSGEEYDSTVSSSAKWVKVKREFNGSGDRKDASKKMYSKIEVAQDSLTVTSYTVGGEVVDQFVMHRGETPAVEPRHFEPYGLNQAFGKDAQSTRRFTWQTPTNLVGAFVEFQNADTGVWETKAGTSNKIARTLTSNNVHKVELTGLQPGTEYNYRLGNTYTSTSSGVTFTYYSDTYQFTTESVAAEPYTFIHMADSQSSDAEGYMTYWNHTLQRALAKYPDASFMIHTGDMINSRSTSQWTGFLDATGTQLSSAAFLPVLGNHEGNSSGDESFYQTIFNVDSENGFPLNYSFTYGHALYINLNSNYTSATELKSQIAWFTREIEQYGADKFIIVSFHKAPFGGTHAGDSDVRRIKQYWVPVFEDLGVNLVLQGHDHNYIRSHPIVGSQPNTGAGRDNVIVTSLEGAVYMVTRNSGEKTYSVTSKSSRPWIDVLWDHTSVRYNVDATTFAAITVEEDQLSVKVHRTDNVYTLVDEYVIVKDDSAGLLMLDDDVLYLEPSELQYEWLPLAG